MSVLAYSRRVAWTLALHAPLLASQPLRSAISVGANVRVSATTSKLEHTEYLADAHPTDPNRLLVCSMMYSPEQNRMTSGIYVSSDRGRTWRLTFHDMHREETEAWDPACAFGANGEAFLLTLSNGVAAANEPGLDSYDKWGPGQTYMPIFRSENGGDTWQPPIKLGFIDNESMTVDQTDGPFRGRVYVYGNVPEKDLLWLAYSRDSGRTFVRSAGTKVDGYTAWHMGLGTVLPDGTLIIPYELYRQAPTGLRRTIAVANSTDGGEHLSTPYAIADRQYCLRPTEGGGRDAEVGAIPVVMASDHSPGPFRGRAYAIWGEVRDGRCAIVLATSDDKGATWTSPMRVDDAPLRGRGLSGPDNFLPQVRVNRDGIVGATWYDRREDPNNRNHRLRFSASLDGGVTWAASVPVSTHATVFTDTLRVTTTAITQGGGGRRARNKTDAFQTTIIPAARLYDGWNKGPGDYGGIAVGADGAFHAFWTDNRTGTTQMYTAPIAMGGRVTKHGDPTLDSLENLTSRLEVRYTSSLYNAATRTNTMTFTLLNTSADTLAGPFIMRVTELGSGLGTARFVLPGGQLGEVGTLFDLSTIIPPAGLPPGASTTSYTIRIRLVTLSGRSGSSGRDVAGFHAQVFGRKR